MAKSMWLVISTLALANILAIAGLFGWLKMTDRLSAERIEEVRRVFSQTVAEQAEEEREREASANTRSVEERLAEGEGLVPVTAPTRNRIVHEQDEIARQRVARAEREHRDLLRTATKQLQELEVKEAAFEERMRAWEEMRTRLTEQESTEQFQKAVKNYEAQKPDVAKNMLDALIERGEMEQVIAYLDAMQARKSAKIVDAFAQDDPALAARLLEQLRTFGIETPEPGQANDDNDLQSDLAANP